MSPSDREYTSFIERKRFLNLNGLRFLCIAAVLWHHSNLSVIAGEWLTLSLRGFLGVDFFFVLSGFLITTLILREMRDTGKFSIKNFYYRRALRILPPYFLLLFIVIGIYVVIKGKYNYLSIVPAYFLFGANFIVEHIPTLDITWSLSVEEQYYLLWPALMLLLPRRWWVPTLCALVAINVGIMLIGQARGEPVGIRTELFFFKMPNSSYAPILLGSLLAVMLDSARGFAIMKGIVGFRASTLVFMALLLLALLASPDDLRGWPNLILHVLMTLTLASLVVREDAYGSSFLRLPWVARVGEISYGIYLYHLLAAEFARIALLKLGLQPLGFVNLIIYVAASIAMAELSFRFLESRALALRHRFTTPAVGGRATA
jgi:peptidoglycan/LPS O-acetylase OafA/YrhL